MLKVLRFFECALSTITCYIGDYADGIDHKMQARVRELRKRIDLHDRVREVRRIVDESRDPLKRIMGG